MRMHHINAYSPSLKKKTVSSFWGVFDSITMILFCRKLYNCSVTAVYPLEVSYDDVASFKWRTLLELINVIKLFTNLGK